MADDQVLEQPAVPSTPAPLSTPSPVHVVSPEGELGTLDPSDLKDALSNGYSLATQDDIQQHKYGGAPQQAVAALEGAGEGASFGLSTGLETALGVPPEDIRGRAEANPISHNVGQVAGLIGSSLIPGGGEANILRSAGEAGAEAVGAKAGGSFLSQVGNDTVKAAFEAGLFQGGEEVSKTYQQDPNQSAETAIANMGLAAVMGGVFGGATGALLRGANRLLPDAPGGALNPVEGSKPAQFISEVDRPAVDAGDFEASVRSSNVLDAGEKEGMIAGLKSRKPDADAIEKAADNLGAPIHPGMTSDSEAVQKGTDSLINGAPTYAGIKTQELFTDGFRKAQGAVDSALGDASRYSKAELGNIMKDSITAQIKEQEAPISALYDQIKAHTSIIPVAPESISSLSAELEKLPDLRLAPSSPSAKLAKDVFNEVSNLKTVDDIKNYRSSLWDRISPTAPPGEKRIAAIISDKLKGLENGAIEAFARDIPVGDDAKGVIEQLIQQKKVADRQYKPFISKLQTLSEQLGKGKLHGAQDAIHFLNNLTPEQVTNKLFSKNNSEFLKFFGKEFPEQMDLMREYQKGVIREAASKTGEMSPKLVFNQVNKLEPEIQKAIFSPSELQNLRDSETYLRAFPKNFNPSGTSGMSAFRAFFEHPTGAMVGNLRDFAIDKFIRMVGSSPEVKNATALAKATAAGHNMAIKAIKSILDPTKATMPVAIAASVTARDKLKKLVQEYTDSPEKMVDMNASNPVPAYNTAFSAATARAVQYLASQKPDTPPKSILTPAPPPSAMEKARYERTLDIAQQPLLVLKKIQEGSITPSDCQAIKAIYPNLYNQLCNQMQAQMVEHVSKGKTVPYKARLGLSLFTGLPLDSSVSPQSVMSAQPSQAPAPAGNGSAESLAKPKRGSASLTKASQQFLTPGQAAERDRLRR